MKEAVRQYKEDPQKVKGLLKELASGLGKLGIYVTIATGIFKLALAGERQFQDGIEREVFNMINDTKAKLFPRGQWKSEYINQLAPQYRAFLKAERKRLSPYTK